MDIENTDYKSQYERLLSEYESYKAAAQQTVESYKRYTECLEKLLEDNGIDYGKGSDLALV